jgi:hypothetical protein
MSAGRTPNTVELAQKVSKAAQVAGNDAQLWPFSEYATRAAVVAALREIESVLSEWTDEDYAASDALDVVADTADALESIDM